MKLRTKILLCATANLVQLGLAVAVFVRFQFQPGAESILLAPGEARLVELADRVAAEIGQAPVGQWDAVLARYSRAHGVELALTLNYSGDTLAGTIKRVPPGAPNQLPVLRPLGPSVIFLRAPPDAKGFASINGAPFLIFGVPHVNPYVRGQAPAEVAPGRSVFFFTEPNPKRYWFAVRTAIHWPDQNEQMPAALLVRSSSIFLTPFLFDSRPWLACLAAIAGITLLCWIPPIRSLTRSVRQITAAAGQIAEGHFDVETAVHRRDEIGQLSEAIHRMAGQLKGFVTEQRRFLGDIAHELCAPIARTRVALGVMEERGEPTQKRYVENAVEEVEHMSGLVNEPLQFSKAGLTAREPDAEPIAIGDLVARVIEREVGQGGGVRLASGGELKVLAQPTGLFRALSNLVRNSLRYAGAHGPITISARAHGDQILLSVADQGPGLPEEALDRVFTPFYRLDDSRSRESGGVGLGLAMVKNLVESSGGTVSCRNLSPAGLEVTIRLRAV